MIGEDRYMKVYEKIGRKFIRYKDAEFYYGIKMTKFQEIAKECNAVIKVHGLALVDCRIIEDYIESFRI